MRLSIDDGSARSAAHAPITVESPTEPDLRFLVTDAAAALRSFHATVDRVMADNPVPVARLRELAGKARDAQLDDAERAELSSLTQQATRQGRAIGAVLGFFLKLAPYPMLREIRSRGGFFQPPFGPILVAGGDAVRNVLERDQEFTVAPYGVEMVKTMSPAHNGGFSTFILSTDDTPLYEPDRQLLSAVCRPEDADAIADIIHQDCMRRLGSALFEARTARASTVDVVQALARFVPVTLGHRYLGVPVAAQRGAFELTPQMLACYGSPIDGRPETALAREDGVIPDEQQMYLWIKAAFRHFFNNVQKDPAVEVEGLRACRLLLAYLLREVEIQRRRILRDEPVDDTMLTRLLRFQLERAAPHVPRPSGLDPRLVSDLRIAENVMGTIVGAVAGQEEATCRVIDSLIRLREGEFETSGSPGHRYGSFAEAQQLARNVLNGADARESRAALFSYCREALRHAPQGEVLVRQCAVDGARIADSRPIAAGTLIFASHGSAMQDVPEPGAFILDRPREHYLHYGWNRHTCLGRHVSPVIIVESMIALLGLEGLSRPACGADESAFPLERRFGRLQLDDANLYATTFSLQFEDTGTTRLFWPVPEAADLEVM
ncbi:MAG: hypothetical protein AB7Q29_11890 [Vicinamibacterales bacterium]